jgi:hypothetical protein
MDGELAAWIGAERENRRPVTSHEVGEFISKKWGLSIGGNTFNHIIKRIPRARSCMAGFSDREDQVMKELRGGWARK